MASKEHMRPSKRLRQFVDKDKKKRKKFKKPQNNNNNTADEDIMNGTVGDLLEDMSFDFSNEENDETTANSNADHGQQQRQQQQQQQEPGKETPVEQEMITHPGITEIKKTKYSNIPVIEGTLERVKVHCTYATCGFRSGRDGMRTACETSEDGIKAFNPEREYWGIFVLKEEMQIDAKKYPLSRIAENDGSKPPADVGELKPLIAIVGSTVQYVASPMFSYDMTVVQVDPDEVLFTPNPTMPVYCIINVDAKRPFKDAMSWTGDFVVRCMLDTMYAVELAVGRDELMEKVANIDSISLADNPADDKPVSPSKMPLNSIVERKVRRKELKDAINKPYKEHSKDVMEGTFMPAYKLKVMLKLPTRLLLLDMEKNEAVFSLLQAGVPIRTMSTISSYDSPEKPADMLRKMSHVRNCLSYEPMKGGGKSYLPYMICKSLWLEPSWFALYYQWLQQVQTSKTRREALASRDKRIQFYRTFIVSDIYKRIKDAVRYNRLHVAIFPKHREEHYFQTTLLYISSLEDVERSFDMATNRESRTSGVPDGEDPMFEEEEILSVKQKVLDMLQLLCKNDVESNGLSPTDWDPQYPVAIIKKYASAMEKLAKTFAGFVARYHNERNNMDPILAETSPIVHQSAYVYSPEQSQRTLDEMKKSITENCPDKTFAHIGPEDTIATMRSAAFSGVTFVILRDVHRWSVDTMINFADAFSSVETGCTHLIGYSYDHTAGSEAGETLVHDLSAVIRAVNLHIGKDDQDMGVHPSLDFVHAKMDGSRTEHIYPSDHRIEQMRQNKSYIVCAKSIKEIQKSTDKLALKHTIKKLKSTGAIRGEPNIAVFYATESVKNKLKMWVSGALKENSLSDSKVKYIKYSEVSLCRHPDLEQPKLIMLANIGHENGPTYRHINFCIERLSKSGMILAMSINEDGLKRRFMRSSRRTDLEVLHMKGQTRFVSTFYKELDKMKADE